MRPTSHTARSILEFFYAAERAFFAAAPEDKNFTSIASVLSEDVVLNQTSGLPCAELYMGPQGFLQFGQDMSEYVDGIDLQKPEFFESHDPTRIVSVGELHIRARKTDEEFVFPMSQLVTVDLDAGVITSILPFHWDVYALNKAIGYTPE
ncbi:hypothetical protein F66182_8622 [Fusarium sp. NRRL 66182]|nr:hypothetical protein F66182_8622 [Fusarium sp. NRRL 66182]